jgi:hypothetical protein
MIKRLAKVLSFDLSDKKISNLNDEPDSESTMLFSDYGEQRWWVKPVRVERESQAT